MLCRSTCRLSSALMARTRWLQPVRFTDFHGIVVDKSPLSPLVGARYGMLSKLDSFGSGWNACASTTEGIVDREGRIRGVTFKVAAGQEYPNVIVGFESSENLRSEPDRCEFAYGVNIYHGALYVYEQGDCIGERPFGEAQVGDSITVTLNEQDKIDYGVNGQVRYTSTRRPKEFPMYLKVSSWSSGPCPVQDVQWILREGEAPDAADTCEEEAPPLLHSQSMSEKEKLEAVSALVEEQRVQLRALRYRLGLVSGA
mmetsp:Transcript_10385/g.18639  ORF Transcript_10385/g.18639 Transcript_10385/m.18639 type:complete len:256 (-) Transcript_10385:193-960(-)